MAKTATPVTYYLMDVVLIKPIEEAAIIPYVMLVVLRRSKPAAAADPGEFELSEAAPRETEEEAKEEAALAAV